MPRNRHVKTGSLTAMPRSDPCLHAPALPAFTFVVRLWQEARADPGAEAIWRGTVSDLHGRPLGSFATAAELVRLIGHASGATLLLQMN